jgi:CheY-like chemotaxis protein
MMRTKRPGCEVDVAGDGLEAVKAASSTPHDLIRMDCQMPVVDGVQATQAICKAEDRAKHVPIVALTANAMEGEREQCLEAGMDGFLSKPVRVDDLAGKPQQWLGSPDASPTPSARPPAISRDLRDQFEAFLGEMREESISPEEIDSVLESFLEVTPITMAELAANIRRQDSQSSCFSAHRLRGSFLTLALGDLSKVMASLEEACRDGRWQKASDDMVAVSALFEGARDLIAGAMQTPARTEQTTR